MTHRSYKHSYELANLSDTYGAVAHRAHLALATPGTAHCSFSSLAQPLALSDQPRLNLAEARPAPARVPTVLSEEYVRAFVRAGQLLNENKITRSHLARAKRISILDHYYIAKLPILNVQTKFKSLSYRINYC